ncbi:MULTISPECIES: putative bifunctional diguanylate cyclase/phosphodiesterase [Pandoraea]|uniref:Putative signaling protein n=2 Tax=Pandoraea TaxID=93217 RepID=A0A5E4XCQ3_9BURK|nr:MULTISPECIES: EAL domain-containing protein [Pandoraea]VVE16383.1 putative signaling protein [Pandoraea cepalis]VVE34097.1 putative signaling protein [Pandoraea terrigena]
MTPSLPVEQDIRSSTKLIETLLEYAILYAASSAEPRDGSCWEAISFARDYLREMAPSASGSDKQPPHIDSPWPELQHELLTGLYEGHFSVDYQPVCELASHAVVGVEALARWAHPKRGSISPVVFIPAAERAGSIHALGRWILLKGCEQMVAWDREGLSIPYLSVNVSPLQLNREAFLAYLDEALIISGLTPSRLVLEVTESLNLLHNSYAVEKTFRELRDRGVRIMIDDFGTGFSSLTYLQNLPFSAIKMDRQFVSKLPSSRTDLEIIKAISQLTRQLGMDLIAEGVETQDQKEALVKLGCNFIQGWLISPALPAAALKREFDEGRLATKKPLVAIAA